MRFLLDTTASADTLLISVCTCSILHRRSLKGIPLCPQDSGQTQEDGLDVGEHEDADNRFSAAQRALKARDQEDKQAASARRRAVRAEAKVRVCMLCSFLCFYGFVQHCKCCKCTILCIIFVQETIVIDWAQRR